MFAANIIKEMKEAINLRVGDMGVFQGRAAGKPGGMKWRESSVILFQ